MLGKAGELLKCCQCGNSFESLAVTAEALLSAPDGKVNITIKENMKTAASEQSSVGTK